MKNSNLTFMNSLTVCDYIAIEAMNGYIAKQVVMKEAIEGGDGNGGPAGAVGRERTGESSFAYALPGCGAAAAARAIRTARFARMRRPWTSEIGPFQPESRGSRRPAPDARAAR